MWRMRDASRRNRRSSGCWFKTMLTKFAKKQADSLRRAAGLNRPHPTDTAGSQLKELHQIQIDDLQQPVELEPSKESNLKIELRSYEEYNALELEEKKNTERWLHRRY